MNLLALAFVEGFPTCVFLFPYSVSLGYCSTVLKHFQKYEPRQPPHPRGSLFQELADISHKIRMMSSRLRV